MIDWKATPVSAEIWLSCSSTFGMSALSGIARESLKRSATRIGFAWGCPVPVAPCAASICARASVISWPSVFASSRFGAMTMNQPTASETIIVMTRTAVLTT